MAPRQPNLVSMMPNDCANKEAIISWLKQVSDTPKMITENDTDYETRRNQAKHRIWVLRYNCQRI